MLPPAALNDLVSMNSRHQYKKRSSQFVIAVQLDLKTEGFTYEKWGGTQKCKPGDWLVNNNGDTYTVDRETFARTYKSTGPGTYTKVTTVWAEKAAEAGMVTTKEGATRYEAGDYIVSNEPNGGGTAAIVIEAPESACPLERLDE